MDTVTAFDTRLLVELRHPGAALPRKAHASDACFDLVCPDPVVVPRGATCAVDLGLGIELEEGWEAQVRGRSGLARRGIVVHAGTVDHLYRQNLNVLIHNLSGEDYRIQAGDRVAQMKIGRVWRVELVAGELETTERGGFGSTGR